MRIIAGKYRGLTIPLPKGGDIRPTTDRAKESLFNILNTRYDLEEISVLELFGGSGNVAFEFASRGSQRILSIEKNKRVSEQAKKFALDRGMNEIQFISSDVFKYVPKLEEQFDIVFADPPYHLKNISQIPEIIHEHKLLKPDGLCIVEHESNLNWNNPYLIESRAYGQSVFSMFQFDVSLDK